jgi:hypothetical protein
MAVFGIEEPLHIAELPRISGIQGGVATDRSRELKVEDEELE